MSSTDSSPHIGLATPVVVRAPANTPSQAFAARVPPSPAPPHTPQGARLQATTLFESPSPLAKLPSPRHPLHGRASAPTFAALASPDAVAPPMVRVPATAPRLRSPVRLDVDVTQVPAWPSNPDVFPPAFWPAPSPGDDLTARFAAMTSDSPMALVDDVGGSPPWLAYTPEVEAAAQQSGAARLMRHPAVLNAVARAESKALLGYVDAWVSQYEDFWPKRHDAVALRDRLVGTSGLLDELRQALANRRRAQMVLRPTAAILRQAEAEATRVPAFGPLDGWVARTHVPLGQNVVGLGLFGIPGMPQAERPQRCYANADDYDVGLEGSLHRLQYSAERWHGCALADGEFYATFLVHLHTSVVRLHSELTEYLTEHPL